jgi:hypothetical protein
MTRNALIDLACVLLLAQVFVGQSTISFVAIGLVGLYVLPVLFQANLKGHFFIIGCFALMLVFGVNSAPMYDYRPIYYLALGISCYVIGNHYAERQVDAVRISRFLLIAFFVGFAVLAATKGYSPSAINTYLPNASRNYVSSVALFLQLFYSVAYWLKQRHFPRITPLLTFGISVLCIGRTGIALSFVVAAVSYAEVYLRRPVFWTLVLSATTVPLLMFLVPPALESIATGTNFQRGVYSLQRDLFLREYLSHITEGTRILTGGNLADLPSIVKYSRNINPHNSYIRGHAYFGLAHTISVGLWLLYIVFLAVKKRHFLTIALLMTYPVRAAFDTLAFFGLFDFVFFFGLLAIAKTPQRRQVTSEVARSRPNPTRPVAS